MKKMSNLGRGRGKVFTLILCFFMVSIVSASNPVFNGVDNDESHGESTNNTLKEGCEEIFGFIPCSLTPQGNIFLILLYGYMMYLAANYLCKGSEILLEILGPGFISGCFLRLLGSLPDALLVLVSGLLGSTTIAEEKVSIGMGLMAGSTVARLTLVWGALNFVGNWNLKDSVTVDRTNTKRLDGLLKFGISVDRETNWAAMIMAASLVPLIVVQIPQVLSSNSGRHLALLIAFIISALLLIGYCLFEVFGPHMQNRWVEYVKHKRVMTCFIKHIKNHPVGRRLYHADGTLNRQSIEDIFKSIDIDRDDHLCKGELTGFLMGIQYDGLFLDDDHIVEKIIQELDLSNDGLINLQEFENGIGRLHDLAGVKRVSNNNDDTMKSPHKSDEEEPKLEKPLLDDKGEKKFEKTEYNQSISKTKQNKAVRKVVLGTVIAIIFVEPLIEAFHNFSNATGIPMFFLSFVALPLVTNFGEAQAAINYMKFKKRSDASLTFSELYGVVTVNNLLCLSIFLAVIYLRNLPWEFSSEMFIILLVFATMGTLSSFLRVFPLWIACLAIVLYPFLLVLAYLLKYVFGWV